MTQEQLAAQIGTTRGALAMWESGQNKPDALALARAQMIGIPMEFVLLGLTRHVEMGYMQPLQQRCAELGAALNGPVPEFPMAAETRGAMNPLYGDPAAPPRRLGGTMHEPKGPGFREDQQPVDIPRNTRRGRPRKLRVIEGDK